jgi:pyruvate formate lyase activating enzyme
MTPEAVDLIAPHLDAINVDLKSFSDEVYRKVLGGRLAGVLETITYLHRKGIWMELTTLLVPGMNDSEEEVRQIARFIAQLSPEIPWHVSRFYPQYKMTETPPTSIQSIEHAIAIGEAEGLQYIYAGNVSDPHRESTHCPKCARRLIARSGYTIAANHLTPEGACPNCAHPCPGVWTMEQTKAQSKAVAK